MRNRLTAILASVVVVLGACQASAPSSATPAPSVAPPPPTATPVPTPIDFDRLLYGSTYAPSPGTPGGTVVISNWQSVEQLNPYFANAFGTFEVLAGTMRTLLVVASDGHYVPDLSAGPITYADNVTEDGGAAGGFTVHVAIRPNLKWSDGVPFTLNDLAYTWKSVLDPAQVGITTTGWGEVDRSTCSPTGSRLTVHFKEPLRRLLGWSPATSSCPSTG